ncbi:hypothetical protein PC128_g13370 [Phytophthora cactorum]|nr:hypothetical protein PC128_g13370 [Phytophthora cactorum]
MVKELDVASYAVSAPSRCFEYPRCTKRYVPATLVRPPLRMFHSHLFLLSAMR